MSSSSSGGSSVSKLDQVLAYYERIEPRPAKMELTPEFISSESPSNNHHYYFPQVLRENMDICFSALCSGVVTLEDVPPSIQTSVEFWQRFVSVCPEGWSHISLETTRIEQVAWLLKTIPTVAAAEEMFKLVPTSLYDRGIWLKIVQAPSFVWSHRVFVAMAPDFVWHDKELVILAVRQTSLVLKDLPPWCPFTEDLDFVVAALGNDHDAVSSLSGRALAMYPDLVATAIRCYDPRDFFILDELLDILHTTIDRGSLWHEKQVVRAWLAQGGDYLNDKFLPEMKHDEQAFLLIAEHNPKYFWRAAPELITKEYFAQVLNVNPNLFRDLPKRQLARDYDLALVALAGSYSSPTTAATSAVVEQKRDELIGLCNNLNEFFFWQRFATWVRDQLLSHELFVSLVLGGIMSLTDDGGHKSTCPLRVLNEGLETCTAYKKLLAEYAGIPMGPRLGALHRASANLSRWGF
jgi:hypothetical protein